MKLKLLKKAKKDRDQLLFRIPFGVLTHCTSCLWKYKYVVFYSHSHQRQKCMRSLSELQTSCASREPSLRSCWKLSKHATPSLTFCGLITTSIPTTSSSRRPWKKDAMRLPRKVKPTRKKVSCSLANGPFRIGIGERDAGLCAKTAPFFWNSTAAEVDVMIRNFA